MPVHELKSAQDFSRESDSGARIDAYIDTLVPEWPAYAWYLAQSPVSAAADEPLPPPDDELLEQAAVSASARTAGTASSRRRPVVTGVVNAVLLARAWACQP
ncbi:hypothetical protein GCM10010195_44160 [Kitasatospora griseola]|nr:hypothetical protein GCM10010195_44160 [Kitasatospora griseola]